MTDERQAGPRTEAGRALLRWMKNADGALDGWERINFYETLLAIEDEAAALAVAQVPVELPTRSRDAIVALGDLLNAEHGESCDCDTCLAVQPLVDFALATPSAQDERRPVHHHDYGATVIPCSQDHTRVAQDEAPKRRMQSAPPGTFGPR